MGYLIPLENTLKFLSPNQIKSPETLQLFKGNKPELITQFLLRVLHILIGKCLEILQLLRSMSQGGNEVQATLGVLTGSHQ